MPLPKRRHSKSRQGKRRSQQGLTLPNPSACPQCRESRMPHRVCPHCGYYDGRAVVEVSK
ncbi:MAG: 50S ribosomal protein L32 [Pseudomonadota bacterium]